MKPQRGDRVLYDSPPIVGAPAVWHQRRRTPSLVLAVAGGQVQCHMDGTATHAIWSAPLDKIRVVARPTYGEVT